PGNEGTSRKFACGEDVSVAGWADTAAENNPHPRLGQTGPAEVPLAAGVGHPAAQQRRGVALNDAITLSPSARPSSPSERRVTTATIGTPQSTTTRARKPRGTMAVIRPAR